MTFSLSGGSGAVRGLARPMAGFVPREDEHSTIYVAGLRGIPEVQGGIERHCQNLYPRIVREGWQVNIFSRSGYLAPEHREYKGIRILPLPLIRTKSMETLSHTCLAVLQAKRLGAKILHLHGIGPGFWTPLASKLGLKVVVTHHGFDYRRQKWNGYGKAMLRRGEINSIRHASGMVCISSEIFDHVMANSPSGIVEKIPNGVDAPGEPPSEELLAKWGLSPRNYVLLTARFVKEKGITDLIQAWSSSGLASRCGLAIAGGEDHPSSYGKEVRALAASTGAVLTGIVGGDDLQALYGHARGFILPSFHEGLPISLLEAMSWGLPVGTSDIVANLEVGLSPDCYFRAGDVQGIAGRIERILSGPQRVDYSSLMTRYDWASIATATIGLYRKVLAAGSCPGVSRPGVRSLT